jgi:hypothetical protein
MLAFMPAILDFEMLVTFSDTRLYRQSTINPICTCLHPEFNYAADKYTLRLSAFVVNKIFW